MKSLTATVLAGMFIFASPALAFDIKTMSDTERTAFRKEIRAYLLDNPEVIFEAVDVMESRKAAQESASDKTLVSVNAQDIFEDGYSWEGGNPDGDITLVEFTDYRCGYCRKAHDEVAELVRKDGNIRFIIKEFPILGEGSVMSSRFAVAVKQLYGSDAYKTAHDALITFKPDATDVNLGRLAKALGYDKDTLFAKMDSDEVTAEIRQTRALASRLNISGTPTFVMKDELLRGYLPLQHMTALVDQKRAK